MSCLKIAHAVQKELLNRAKPDCGRIRIDYRYWPKELGEPRADSLGFNPPLVKEFKKRYGVEVLSQEFDVEKWRALHGEFLTADFLTADIDDGVFLFDFTADKLERF